MYYSQDNATPSNSLFQSIPLQRELNRDYAHKLSHTSSREAYNNYMRRLVFVLEQYARPATVTVTLNFLKEFDAKTLNLITQKMHRRLRKDKAFAAFFINEITTNGIYPINRLHRHYIVAGTDSIEDTRQAFHSALPKDLVSGVDYKLTVQPIETFKGLVFYLCKYGKIWGKYAILFTKIPRHIKGVRIPKYGVIGKFFLDADGKEAKTQSVEKLYRQHWQHFYQCREYT